MPETALHVYRSAVVDPADFDAFWEATLGSARELAASRPTTFVPFPTPLVSVSVTDVAFAGFGGDEVRGWLIVPAGVDVAGPGAAEARPGAAAHAEPGAAADAGPGLPAVVEYLGYGGGQIGRAHV